MNTPERNGVVVMLYERGEYLRGDVYRVGTALIFKCNKRSWYTRTVDPDAAILSLESGFDWTDENWRYIGALADAVHVLRDWRS